MTQKFPFRSISAALLMLFSALSFAQPGIPQEVLKRGTAKTDREYYSFSVALNEFRSVRLILTEVGGSNDVLFDRFPMSAQTYSISFGWGTYITEHFKTELRYGTGVRDDSFLNALDVNFNYWFNWYIGAAYPLTDDISGYVMYGLSHYDADVTRRQIIYNRPIDQEGNAGDVVVQPDPETIPDKLFGTSFSTSWLIGLDYRLFDTTYLAFEYGRLLRDTDTNIKVYQANLQLRYEF